MGVSITLGRRAVGCPTGMGDADRAVHRVTRKVFDQLVHLADRATAMQLMVVSADDREPCGVVAAILQPQQSFQQNAWHVAPRNCSYDAAHLFVSLPGSTNHQRCFARNS